MDDIKSVIKVNYRCCSTNLLPSRVFDHIPVSIVGVQVVVVLPPEEYKFVSL